MKKLMIIVGDPSADRYAAEIIKFIKKIDSSIYIFGSGGDHMIKAGIDKLCYHSNKMAFMGFIEVVKHLPEIIEFNKILKSEFTKEKPDLVLLCDYPGYNLKFAEFSHKNNCPVYYFISPQIWAWKKNRYKKIKKYIEKMFVILPFEKEFYKNLGIEVDYFGHPLPFIIKEEITYDEFKNKFNIKDSEKIIALLPGSRKQELHYILPEMLISVEKLTKKFNNLKFILALAPNLDEKELRSKFKINDNIIITKGLTYSVMKYSDFALVTSGTATLETALFNTPMIVLYKMNFLTFYIARLIVDIKYISLVNLIAEKEIIPELIQYMAISDNIVKKTEEILFNEEKYKKIKKELSELNKILTIDNPMKIIATKIIDKIKKKNI